MSRVTCVTRMCIWVRARAVGVRAWRSRCSFRVVSPAPLPPQTDAEEESQGGLQRRACGCLREQLTRSEKHFALILKAMYNNNMKAPVL